MYRNVLTISIAFLATDSGPNLGSLGGTTARANPTPAQTDLVNRVFKEQRWPGLWFDSVTDGNDDWLPVSALLGARSDTDTGRKLRTITRMMGCDYGLRLHWLLTLAVYVVGECNYLSLHGHGTAVQDCWNKTVGRVDGCLSIMIKLMHILTYVHYYVVDDTCDHDRFYRALLPVQAFQTQRQQHRDGVKTLQDVLAFVGTMNTIVDGLHAFMTDHCRPHYRPLVVEEIMDEHETLDPRNYSYVFYIYKIDSYTLYINEHLSRLGFRYIRSTGRTFFDSNS